jgi:hypothetical protein
MPHVSVTPSLLHKLEYIVTSSEIGEFLAAAVPKDNRGRKSGLTWDLFVLGSLISAYLGQGHVLSNVYDILTEHIDRYSQVRLGIRKNALSPPTFSYDGVSRMSLSFAHALDYGQGTKPDLSDEERARRRDLVLGVTDRLLAVTLIPSESSTFAIDGSGIWAWGKAPGRPRIGEDTRPDQADEDESDDKYDPTPDTDDELIAFHQAAEDDTDTAVEEETDTAT